MLHSRPVVPHASWKLNGHDVALFLAPHQPTSSTLEKVYKSRSVWYSHRWNDANNLACLVGGIASRLRLPFNTVANLKLVAHCFTSTSSPARDIHCDSSAITHD